MDFNALKEEWGGSLSAYAKGLSISFVLTVLSFGLVALRLFSNRTTAFIITALALIQAAIQLIFFLHVAHEKAPRWRLHFFYSMVGLLVIIAAGTLWIMNDLNSRMMAHD